MTSKRKSTAKLLLLFEITKYLGQIFHIYNVYLQIVLQNATKKLKNAIILRKNTEKCLQINYYFVPLQRKY